MIYVGVCDTVHIEVREDVESVIFSNLYLSLGVKLRLSDVGGKGLYPLSHLLGPVSHHLVLEI